MIEMLHLPGSCLRTLLAAIVFGCLACPATRAADQEPVPPATVAAEPSDPAGRVAEPPGMPADASADTVIGQIKGKPITLGYLKQFAHERLEQQRATYELRRKQLDLDYRRAQQQVLEEELKRSLDQQVLSLEAESRRTNVLKLSGEVRIPPVSEDEVRARYESRKVQGAPPFEQVAAEIRKGLEEEKSSAAMEAYYSRLRTKYGASGAVQPLRQAVAADGPARGPSDAPVTIVEFADFQCPFCRRMVPTLQHVLERYPTQVRIVFRYLPLTEIHPEALHAAEAAVCAQRQGKFWEMHDAIFSDDSPLGIGSLRAIAARIGLNSDTFETCVRDPDVNKPINSDVHAAESLGVRATPTLFVNGRFLQGGMPEESIIALIDDELKIAKPAAEARTAAR
jgi:protein-disulfide isomerase